MKIKGISDKGILRIAQGWRGLDDAPENYPDNDVLVLDIKFIDFLISRLNAARDAIEGPESGESVFKGYGDPDWQRDEVVRSILDEVAKQIYARFDEVDDYQDSDAQSFGAE